VVAFGILGTIIMMMAERKKEMGVMVAIGMQKHRLQRILSLESVYMGLIGVLIGVVLSLPIIAILINHPVPLPGETAKIYESFGIEAVLYFSMIPRVFINQALTVFIMALIITLYPVISVRRLNVTNALHGL
jgi:ABC-type antimicrobial peptide transport system permease subunit